ncbi:YtxH domain-containing protein [Gulosibacter chungangensis]|uniref:YtxH domain-containing protein n=1 Tax=Gulosibacter chungangensis TaxID=979746 RepID=A0A7J5BFK3_9MICO|nr:YtxH domain-containing protein [Gulosibacter chungangensis]KAB1645014.1 YtxH domain-containing protein [Gulosibacter chungangensis]
MKTSSKLALVVGLAAGYVLGARAGRERYDQIAAGAKSVWNSGPVQKQVDNVQGLTGKYVPKAVESSFRGLGKLVSGLVSKILGSGSKSSASKNRASKAPEAPAGTVPNPA